MQEIIGQDYISDRMIEADTMLADAIEDTNPLLLFAYTLVIGPEKLKRLGYPDGLRPHPAPCAIKKVYQLP